MDLAVDAVGLTKRFAKKTVLSGVDLRIPAGTICGLLGPNGAGKTTMVRILATLLRPDGGHARVAGLRRGAPGRRGTPPDRARRAVRGGRRDHRPGVPTW